MRSNSQIQNRKDKSIARGQGNLAAVYVEKACNAEVWDVEGKRYIDFGSGIAVSNTGHSHPKIVAAVAKQLDKFSHTCVMVTPYECAVELAEKLNAVAPGDSEKKCIFVTTGAEAVENCIKIARAHTGRRGVIAFNGGFHGRTNLTMGLTGKITPYKNLFGPFPGEIYHVPFPVNYHGVSEEASLKALENLFKVDISPQDVAAIIIEPVQGEGGFYPASTAFLKRLRQLCDQYGILLIADEIQTGFARTGQMFCMQHHNVEPDLITMAKGIAGGYPLAAVVGKSEIMDAPLPGGLGGTYAGSPIACSAALAVLDIIKDENLIERANEIGDRFQQRLVDLKSDFSNEIGDIRVTGAMIAIELVCDATADKPNVELTRALVEKACHKGLILLSCGFYSNVIRFLPPLTISDEIIDEGLDILTECFRAIVS
ncbi:4-aminobutyrate--2-oxoglutarate transaminase [Aliikangiella sp. G2MR2-5]|uniref:4-aminobutyrate--2-oxoglutarate transaminase n=1 Tax=Aliikangiella sp. G2MR2-5 TaxID=2788943 RepID=UPI0018A9F9F2|nr:4-aminobutyrate--2-oxoglutarate transaminase [Aliikangiella sp. G2MR2-5]